MDYILEISKIKLITYMNKYIHKCENLNNYIDTTLDFIKKYNKISIKDVIHENNINFNVSFNIAMLSQLLFVKCEKFEPIAICSVQEHEIMSSRFYKIVSYGIDDITHKIYKYLTFFKIDNDGNFNLNDIYERMLKLKKSQGRILLVVNDPCQNPTGYTMKYSEWEKLIEIINSVSNDGTPVILLHDMAYIDYDKRGFDATRKNISLYRKLNPSAMAIMAFSGSKTMALYGLRVGAMIAVSSCKENIDDFSRANKFSSRSKWSNTTNLGMNIVTKVLTDPVLRGRFEEELELSRKTLINRANAFIEESKNVGLKTLPFDCGFFITIPCSNPNKAYEYLVNKKVHIIPMDDVLRVTLSAITLDECKMLPKLIKEAILAVK